MAAEIKSLFKKKKKEEKNPSLQTVSESSLNMKKSRFLSVGDVDLSKYNCSSVEMSNIEEKERSLYSMYGFIFRVNKNNITKTFF